MWGKETTAIGKMISNVTLKSLGGGEYYRTMSESDSTIEAVSEMLLV